VRDLKMIKNQLVGSDAMKTKYLAHDIISNVCRSISNLMSSRSLVATDSTCDSPHKTPIKMKGLEDYYHHSDEKLLTFMEDLNSSP